MTMRMTLLVCLVPWTTAGVAAAEISDARRDDHGFFVHTVVSSYQAGRTDIRVLLPDAREKGKRYPVVYVLPVEPGRETRFGDGLLEVKKHDLQNKHEAVFVAPSFSHLPWYADHPANVHIRQETYFTRVVVPFVDQTYPVSNRPDDRLLLGFSKSGWGAWTMLLRHPQLFGRAAAWDAPMMMKEIGKYGTGRIFGTPENFGEYRVSDLLRLHKDRLRNKRRLMLTGYGNFRAHHRRVHRLLTDLEIPHAYQDGPQRPHDWHSGWLPEAVARLVGKPARS